MGIPTENAYIKSEAAASNVGLGYLGWANLSNLTQHSFVLQVAAASSLT